MSTSTTFILDPFQRLIPHVKSIFKTKIKGLGNVQNSFTLTTVTNYSTSTLIIGITPATKPLKFDFKIYPGSAVYEADGPADFQNGSNRLFWNIHSGTNNIEGGTSNFVVKPQPFVPEVSANDSWEEMLGTIQDPFRNTIISDFSNFGGAVVGFPTFQEYIAFGDSLYGVQFFLDNQYMETAGFSIYYTSAFAYKIFSQGFFLSSGGGGKFQFLEKDTASPFILNNSAHVVTAKIVRLPYPGRREISFYSQSLQRLVTYTAIPTYNTTTVIAEVSQTVYFSGSRILTSTANTGTVSSNTGSSTATSVELLYYVGNQRASESIDVLASFTTGTSWANIWELPNKFKSKSTSTGQLLISADLQFNGDSIETVQDTWPISTTGSKLVGKLYNIFDMKVSSTFEAGKLYTLTTSTNTSTSGLSTVSFTRNNPNTVSINITFTDDTATVYTTSSSITATWV